MNLHEYQGKEILQSFGVKVQSGVVVSNLEELEKEIENISKEENNKLWVIKAQIHAGGRGKGGGIKIAKNLKEIREQVLKILGMRLITPQTPKEGKIVNKVLIAKDVYYPGLFKPKEYYLSILLDRNINKNMIMYSTEGGMEIEEIAKNTPEKIYKEYIDPFLGIQYFQARKIAFNLKLTGDAYKNFIIFIINLYKAYIKCDALLFEVNPVLKTSDEQILAVDIKIILDNNALFRHIHYSTLRDYKEENTIEIEANKVGLNFIKLDGNVACMVNGAGLAMATMDMIKLLGGNPANFLDVGGTADSKRVENAFHIILNNPDIKAILINIFGGIVRCDNVAQGIINTYKSMKKKIINIPVIVRLQGTNFEQAKKMIDNSGFYIYSAITLKEAAEKVQEVLS